MSREGRGHPQSHSEWQSSDWDPALSFSLHCQMSCFCKITISGDCVKCLSVGWWHCVVISNVACMCKTGVSERDSAPLFSSDPIPAQIKKGRESQDNWTKIDWTYLTKDVKQYSPITMNLCSTKEWVDYALSTSDRDWCCRIYQTQISGLGIINTSSQSSCRGTMGSVVTLQVLGHRFNPWTGTVG